jgi:hypothetical protein
VPQTTEETTRKPKRRKIRKLRHSETQTLGNSDTRITETEIQKLEIQKLGIQKLGIQKLGIQKLGIQKLGIQKLGILGQNRAEFALMSSKGGKLLRE